MSSNNNKIDVFELAKSVDFKSYLESFYRLDFNAAGFSECPFCGSSKTKAFSYHKSKHIVKCFSCMPKAMGIIDFVMASENCDALSAAKKICNDMGLIGYEDEKLSKEEWVRQQKELEAKRNALLSEKEARRKKEEAKNKKIQEMTLNNMRRLEPVVLEAGMLQKEKFKKILNWTDKLDAWYFDYLGWDEEQQSICIVNRSSEKKEIYDIKHQVKFAWDKEKKAYSNERMPGKWISQPCALENVFPLDYFTHHKDEKVVISFGEKDALNLLGLDVNTLTLGGINKSFEPYKELLKGKCIYIFPDNQLVEYIAALAKYNELKDVAKEIYIVSFFHIDKMLPEKYDISNFIMDNKFQSKDEFFKIIEYSCFKVTNSFIEDVAAFFYKDEKLLQRLESFRIGAKTKSFFEIEDEICKAALPVKSELDIEISNCETQLEALHKHDLLREFKAFIGERYDGEGFVNVFKKAMELKRDLFGKFRKQYEADVGISFIADAKRSGHEVANYRSNIYFWTGSHYAIVDEKELKIFIFQKWMSAAKLNTKQHTPDFMFKVYNGIFWHGTALERIKENQHYRVINFDNGTGYLYPSGKFVFRPTHLKEDGATNILPLSYNKNAKAKKWSRFLNEVLPDITEQNALMEFIGYCFLNTHSFQKFLFLLGSGANGKSIVLNVIRKFFGESVSNVDLQQLYSHEMLGIEGKYINIGSEINPRGLGDGQMENLKKLTAGEPTQLNPKNAKPYDIKTDEIPKFVFSGNTKPQGNLDDGLFRRMLLLNFNKTISKEERIQALEERFIDELSGIFNLALLGLNRLLTHGDFSMSANMQRSIDEYKEEANPILAYLNENTQNNTQNMISKKFFYLHYKKWCEEKGHHVSSERTFFGRVKDKYTNIRETQPHYTAIHSEILGSRPRFIVGIALISDEIELINFSKTDIKIEEMNIDVDAKTPVIYKNLVG